MNSGDKLSPKDRAADNRLKLHYHITLKEYNKVFKYQGYVCAICKRPVETGKNRLAVDHRHLDGALRGLLCWQCNKGIAIFKDDIVRLEAAVEYLKNPPFTAALGEQRYTAPGKIGTKKRAKLLLIMKKVQKWTFALMS